MRSTQAEPLAVGGDAEAVGWGGVNDMGREFRGKRITVMGLGTFGGGVGVVRYLVAQGGRVTVTDLSSAEELRGSLGQLEGVAVEAYRLGGHVEGDFVETDLVVSSPAVPAESRFLQLARQQGVPVTSEMNLFWERCPARRVCVTGSNGKSTTSGLLHALWQAGLEGSGFAAKERWPLTVAVSRGERGEETGVGDESRRGPRCWLGGNIGRSLLPDLNVMRGTDWVVLELSSFQLENLAPLHPRPDVAVVTNFTPNHLDRHGTIENYRAAKQQLLHWQSADQLAVLNADDADVRTWTTAARTYWFALRDHGREGVFGRGDDAGGAVFRHEGREVVFPLGEWLRLPGRHNFANGLAAACAFLAAGGDLADLERGLRQFAGLPHRLQLVAQGRGRLFVNDSKATTPEAVQLALEAYRQPVILLAGGYDKGIDLAPLVRAVVQQRVKGVAWLGQTGPGLAADLQQCGTLIPQFIATSLDEAFAWSVGQSAAGDVILLSPGCASYDWFRNYEERGETFTTLARTWCAGDNMERG